jgi:CHASE3 domain sensor protein
VSDDITNNELARRLDDIRASLSTFVLKDVARAEAITLEAKMTAIRKDLDELESEVKDATRQQIDNKRQLFRLFVGALLASVVPLVVLIVSMAQGVPQ